MRPIDERDLIRRISELPDLRTFSLATIGKCIKDCRTVTIDDLRPKGRWVKKPWKILGCVLRYDTVCSECGFDAPEFAAGGGSTVLTKFCHNCGAKMMNGEADE